MCCLQDSRNARGFFKGELSINETIDNKLNLKNMDKEKRIKLYILAFYDEHGCFDEMRIDPYQLSDIEYALFCISQGKLENGDYTRLYVIFEDGAQGEIKFNMISNS